MSFFWGVWVIHPVDQLQSAPRRPSASSAAGAGQHIAAEVNFGQKPVSQLPVGEHIAPTELGEELALAPHTHMFEQQVFPRIIWWNRRQQLGNVGLTPHAMPLAPAHAAPRVNTAAAAIGLTGRPTTGGAVQRHPPLLKVGPEGDPANQAPEAVSARPVPRVHRDAHG